MEVFLARQPIFDSDLKVVAYELLFRRSADALACVDDGDIATARVINAAFYSSDGGDFLRGKLAYLNFPKGMLVNRAAVTLPPHGTVIEVLESVEPDSDVVDACRDLRQRGYTLALDDVVPGDDVHPLTPFVQIVKVDLRASTPEQVRRGAEIYGGKVQLLAEKVETQEEWSRVASLGYQLFQGYFFARPRVISRNDVPAFKLNYLRVMAALHDPDLDFTVLERQLSQEASLSFKMLRFVNSALYSLREPISSIRQAMMIIGERDLRRWLFVALMMGLAEDHLPELLVNTLARAGFCEDLAAKSGVDDPGMGFLLGMLSRIDTFLGRPLEEVLDSLNVHRSIRDVLFGSSPQTDRLALVWAVVKAHETADWRTVSASAAALKLTAEAIASSYAVSLAWVDAVFVPGHSLSAEAELTA